MVFNPEREARIEFIIREVAVLMIRVFDEGMGAQRSASDIELKREMRVTLGSMHEETTPMVADAKNVQQDVHKQTTDYANVKRKEIELINQELTTVRISTTALVVLTSAKDASLRAFMA